LGGAAGRPIAGDLAAGRRGGWARIVIGSKS
jgi:hypothetical protein